MSDLLKTMDYWKKRGDAVKSEQEALELLKEIRPDLEKMKEVLFGNKINSIDIGLSQEEWINEIHQYISNTIKLYLEYHVKGVLECINLSLAEEDPPIIRLTINGKEYLIDFEENVEQMK